MPGRADAPSPPSSLRRSPSFWTGCMQDPVVADRLVESEFLFDRLGPSALAQAYRVLIPERRRTNEGGASHGSSSHLRQGVVGTPARGGDDRLADGGASGPRRAAGA